MEGMYIILSLARCLGIPTLAPEIVLRMLRRHRILYHNNIIMTPNNSNNNNSVCFVFVPELYIIIYLDRWN